MPRSAAACALPRPSATASAKLANSTVNHSQAAIWPEKRGIAGAGQKLAQEDRGDHRRHHLGDEDDGIANELARIELDEGVARGSRENAGDRTAMQREVWRP